MSSHLHRRADGGNERRRTIFSYSVRIGPGLEQGRDDVCVALVGGDAQGCGTVLYMCTWGMTKEMGVERGGGEIVCMVGGMR